MTGERHTRQGTARGQKWGTLDRDGSNESPSMDMAHAATRHSAMLPARRMSDDDGPPMLLPNPRPCTWCVPGEPCAFHQPDPTATTEET